MLSAALRVLTLVVLVASVAEAQTFRGASKNRGSVRRLAALSSFASTSGQLPNCAADPGCVLDCGVGVATGADAWECVGSTGAQVSVTQGTGTTYEGTWLYPTFTSWNLRTLSALSDAKAPYIAAATAQAVLGAGFYAGDHTLIAYGSIVSNGVLFSHGQDGQDGLYLESTGCGWSSSPSLQVVSHANPITNRWGVRSCRRSGSNYIARANATNGTAAVTVTAANPSAKHIYFGRYNTAGLSNGSLAPVRLYNRALSDAELAIRECQLNGGWADTSDGVRCVTTTRSGAAYVEGDDGFVYAIGDNAPRVTSRGVLSFEARTNVVTSPLDVSSGTLVQTPIITANTHSGLFSRFSGGPEGDTLNDDDSVLHEGVQTPSAGTWATATSLTMSSIVAAGTRNDATQRVIVDGTTVTDCTYAGLDNLATATCSGNATAFSNCDILCAGGRTCRSAGAVSYPGNAARLTCTGSTAGAATDSFGQLLVGDAATETGTLIVYHRQLERAPFAGPPNPTSTATNADVHTLSTAGWPTTSGEVELAYTPTHGTGATRVLLDSRDSAPDGINVFIYDDTRLGARTNSTTFTEAASAALTWTAGTTYCIRYIWGASGASLFRAAGTWSGGTLTCGSYGTALATAAGTNLPPKHRSTAAVGTSVANIEHANGQIKLLYVGAPR